MILHWSRRATDMRRINQCLCGEDNPAKFPAYTKTQCILCVRAMQARYRERNRERYNEIVNNWRKANPAKAKASWYRSRYGIEPEEYEHLYAEQNNRCAACGIKPDKLVVDHCHSSGTVRGLLCNDCNVALGWARECPNRLRALADYIERMSSVVNN